MTATATIGAARAELSRAAEALTGVGRGREREPSDNGGDSLARPEVGELAELIQAADQFIELLCATPTEGNGDREELLIVTRALRRAAFLLLSREVPEQAWFWTPEWQAGELAADADKRAGLTTIQTSDEEFMAALRARRPHLANA